MSIYQDDLAYIHAIGFGDLARGAAPEVIRRLSTAHSPIHHVLDVGCGAGPLAAALAIAGFEVTGIDASAQLIAMARSAVPRARFIEGSIYEAELPRCDAIVAVSEPLTYHRDTAGADSRVAAFLRRAAASLPPGGLLIFDIVEIGEPPLSGRTWASGDDWAVLVETHEDQAARSLLRGIETFRRAGDLYRRGREVHHVRLFDTAALCRELSAHGFSVETAPSYGTQPLPPRRRAFFCERQ
jgi:SAM-dependent methyltransferase